MLHEWVLDVLSDLRSFAQENDLAALAAHLDDAGLIAAAEIASHQERAPAQLYGKAIAAGRNPEGFGSHR